MKRLSIFLLLFVFSLSVWALPVMAEDTSTEIEQLKGEIQKLLKRVEELEKKQVDTQTKTVETEKKVAAVEEKAVKAEKKSLKDRVDFSGEARFRIMSETATTDEGFYGDGQPSSNIKDKNKTGFPTRIRLNAHAELVPDIVDFYARLTMNKNWGAYSSTLTDPFNRPNSFEASKGHDITPRFEQAYATFKIPSYNTTWYVGRLPGLDGPPSRQARSLFPRLFVDSEIDGTLIKWDAPKTALDDVELPWSKNRLWGEFSKSEDVAALKSYEAKVNDITGIILGYLKYDEQGLKVTEDANVYLAQAQVKVGKDTAIVLDSLYMDDWHMPRTTFGSKDTYTDSAGNKITIPDLTTPYYLAGVYADTQVLGFQVYGAFYYSHFRIPEHTWTTKKADGTTTSTTYEGQGFPGRIWYLGFNTGDMITPNQQLCVEYAKGSDAWINPFNYRGYRRKGTVLEPANNYYYNSGKDNVTAGFYPFDAQVWDVYYDYYFRKKVRFRLGLMDFIYSKHESNDDNYSILGSSKYQNDWWPYFEVNISF